MSARWTEVLKYLPGFDSLRAEEYVAELYRWNRAIRLVGPKDVDGIRVQAIDALLPYLFVQPRFPLLDIGSGAGLPAIVLAIAFPNVRIVCLEPIGKRVSFLRHVARHLGLPSVEVVQGRADSQEPEDSILFGHFATVTGRAVAETPTMLLLAGPYLSGDGEVWLPRGGDCLEVPKGWTLLDATTYCSYGGVGARKLLKFRRDSG